jgi:hypothetical protein
MEPLRLRHSDHRVEEHSGRIAPGTQKTRRGHPRSLNKEIIATLKSAASGTTRLGPTKLEESVRWANSLFRSPITAREIDWWKREGQL